MRVTFSDLQVALLSTAVAGALTAQVHPDAWFYLRNGDKIIAIEPSGPFLAANVLNSAQHLAAGGFGCVFADGLYVASAWYSLGEVRMLGGLLNFTATPLSSGMLIAGAELCASRRLVYALDDGNGILYSAIRGAGLQTLTSHGVLLPNGLANLYVALATNGRDLFFANAGVPYVVSTGASPMTAVPVPNWPAASLVRDCVLGPDGKWLIAGSFGSHWLKVYDPVAGTVVAHSAPPPAGYNIAYNHWTDRLIISSLHLYERSLSDPPNVPSTLIQFNFTPVRDVASNAELPFEFFGAGCVNSTGRDPRLGWTGLPRQGQAFSINLRDAEPNGFAMMWLGWSDTFWAPVGALPFNAASLGAPGCQLLVAPESPLPFWVDGNGRASYSISLPVNPAIAGIEIFAQSVSASGANALGFSSSDALVIRLR